MILRLNRVLLCWALILQLAVLPSGRAYAFGDPPTKEQIATLFAQSFDSLGRTGWRSFDLNSGAELEPDASVDRLQAANADEPPHIGIVKAGVPFLVDIVTTSTGSLTIKTYPLKHKPDLGHMTTRDVAPLLKSVDYRGTLDISQAKSPTELASEIHTLSGDVEDSIAKNIGPSGHHVGLKIGIASTLIILVTAAVLAAPIAATYGHYLPSKKTIGIAMVVTSLEIFGASLGIVKNAEAANRKMIQANKPICTELLK